MFLKNCRYTSNVASSKQIVNAAKDDEQLHVLLQSLINIKVKIIVKSEVKFNIEQQEFDLHCDLEQYFQDFTRTSI